MERTHCWLNRFWHLLIRMAEKLENYSVMLHFACAELLGIIVYLNSLLVIKLMSMVCCRKTFAIYIMSLE